jgi:hypothetical protein
MYRQAWVLLPLPVLLACKPSRESMVAGQIGVSRTIFGSVIRAAASARLSAQDGPETSAQLPVSQGREPAAGVHEDPARDARAVRLPRARGARGSARAQMAPPRSRARDHPVWSAPKPARLRVAAAVAHDRHAQQQSLSPAHAARPSLTTRPAITRGWLSPSTRCVEATSLAIRRCSHHRVVRSAALVLLVRHG